MLEDGNLFEPFKDGELDDELHLAQMVSLMGAPPKQFLERSEKCRKWWNSEGKILLNGGYASFWTLLTTPGVWIGATAIPSQTLESREIRLKGQDRELLLALVRKILRWLPEERPSAEELFEDDFIGQFMSQVKPTPL